MTIDPNATVGGGDASTITRSMDDEISLWEVLAVLLRRRGTIAVTIVLTVAAAVAFTLLRHDEYTTQASFRPQGSEASASQLMALASQFGVNVPGTTA